MKLFIVVSLLLCGFAPVGVAKHFWFGKTMTPIQAEHRWGKGTFSAEVFKKSSPDGRAKIAASLLRQKKQWIGKSLSGIKEVLGEESGHYFTDWIPTYLIEIGKNDGDETWQIVFVPDNEYKVKDIIIHRNCCDH